jgi:phosphoesterase RecJ-like protein
MELPQAVRSFLSSYDRYLILGHLEPDGDCVASQLALAGFLRRLGREALLYSDGPFDRPEIRPFRQQFQAELRAEDREGSTAVVVVDSSTPDRAGSAGRAAHGLPVLVIDHHAAGEAYGWLRWVEPAAPAVSHMIQLLIEQWPEKLTPTEAELLLFGLACDTGFFRHLDGESAPIFGAVSRLVEAGASPRKVYRMIHWGWEMGKVRLLARTLGRARTYLDGRLILTFQTLADLARAGPVATRGSDELYRILQNVRGVEVVAFLQEEKEGCTVGLRSNTDLDVGQLARSLGGGGHVQASGYALSVSIPEARRQLLRALRELLRPKG